ncbi:hypothetical protein [Roseivirga sp.]|nr:hypothetical protein [Roseivirga sp.]
MPICSNFSNTFSVCVAGAEGAADANPGAGDDSKSGDDVSDVEYEEVK